MCVYEDMTVHGLKIGMLFDRDTVKAVCDSLSIILEKDHIPLVVDPVCVSTSGHTLLESDALESLISFLFPLATVITPNRQEAIQLLESSNYQHSDIRTLEDMLKASSDLANLGPKSVLLKGGHILLSKSQLEDFRNQHPEIQLFDHEVRMPNAEVLEVHGSFQSKNIVVDVLYEASSKEWSVFARSRIETTSTHGTGCTLSAAIACYLAKGSSSKRLILLVNRLLILR
jgi:hydroxymethylpyrimidine/phosphomethylpyrimidine kinase / thiaminase